MISLIMLMVTMISMTPNVDVFQSEQPQISSNTTDTTVTDIDGNVYETVRIGHQIWMAENLRTSRFRDGSEIPNIQNKEAWNSNTIGAWVNYDHDVANDSIYGKLYNFKAISNPAGVCPEGWQVPSNDEFLELIEHLGGNSVAGGKLKATGDLTNGTGLWVHPNGSATNQSGFSAIPGGEYYSNNDVFKDIGRYAKFWTASPTGQLSYGSPTYFAHYLTSAYGLTSQFWSYSNGGYSIRCTQEVAPPTILDETIIVRGTTKALIQSFLSIDDEHTPTEIGVIWGRANSASPLLTVQNADGRIQSSSSERGTHEVYITNLSPATDYQLRAYAFVVDTAGTSQAVYSNIMRITTLNPDSLEYSGTLMVQDIEGNDYPIVEINGVNWFAKNLYVSSYRDGTPIPGVTSETASEWGSGGGKWVSVNYDSTHDATIGKLYNGQSVRWWRGVCPAGWIVPTKSELEGLRDFLGDYTTAGGPLKSTGTIQDGDGLWKAPNTGATNTTGFSAVPAGRYHSGQFEQTTAFAYIWSRSISSDFQHYVNLYNSSTTFWMAYDNYKFYNSVRCMRSSPIEFPQTATVVTMPEPTTLTQTLAVLQGSATPDGDGEISEWGVVLATHSTPTIQDVKLDANDPIHFIMDGNRTSDPDSTGSFSSSPDSYKVLATGLSSGTEYYARAYAIIDGNISYGNSISFETNGSSTPPVTDIDGNVYATIQIGDQEWMAENLRVSRFNDSTLVPNLAELTTPLSERTPGWLSYENNANYEQVYGKLYNWAVVEGDQNICPDGWRVPTRSDWAKLVRAINPSISFSINSGTVSDLRVKGNDFWIETTNTNSSGFSLLPSGIWTPEDGFSGAHEVPMTENVFTEPWTSFRIAYNGNMYPYHVNLTENSSPLFLYEEYGMDEVDTPARSVRCLKGPRKRTPVANVDSVSQVGETFADIDWSLEEGETALTYHEIFVSKKGSPEKVSRYAASQSIRLDFSIPLINHYVGVINLEPNTEYEITIDARSALNDMIRSESTIFSTLDSEFETLQDVSGNLYSTIQIGDRQWMAENLRTNKYRNGQGLLTFANQGWFNGWGAYQWKFENIFRVKNRLKGFTYNTQAIINPTGICPSGWSIPTREEWLTLIAELGGADVAGEKVLGLDSESNLNLLPSGMKSGSTGTWLNLDDAFFWSSTSDSVTTWLGDKKDAVWLFRLDSSENTFNEYPLIKNSYPVGASVRCIKDIVITAPVLEPVEVTDITQTRATFQATVQYDGGGTLSDWGLYLSLDPEPGPEDRVLVAQLPQTSSNKVSQDSTVSDSLSTSQTFQITIDSLISGAAYYTRMYATNESGTGLGDIVRFRTPVDTTGVTVTDIDGNIYRTVQIGDQLWMKDNLRTTRYQNGDLIDHIPDSSEWASLTFLDEDETIGEGAWVNYRNDSENEIPFGKLYNWFAVTHPSGICPAGWQVPSREDWEILIQYAGGADIAGGNLKATGTLEAGTGLWLAPNEGATDSVGFSALPADFRWPDGEYSLTKGENAIFWTSTRENEYYAYNTAMNRYFEYIDRPSSDFAFGFSVRCLRDDRSAPPLPDQPDSLQTDVAYQTPVDQQNGFSAQVISDVDTTTVLSVQIPPAATQQVQDGDGRPRQVGKLEITAVTEQTVVELLGLRSEDEPSEDEKALLQHLQNRISDLYKVELYGQDDAPIEDPRFEKPATLCILAQTLIDERIGGSNNVGFIRIETGSNGDYELIEETFTSVPESRADVCAETDGFSVFALVPVDLTKVSEAPFPRPKGQAPSIVTPEDTYIDSLYISIGVAEAGTIRYTLDGTQPNDTSEVYIDPILIKEPGSITIRAIAEYETYSTSEVVTATYTLRIQTLETPSILFPENETENVGILTEFEWSATNGAEFYTLELIEETPFSEPIRYEGLTGNYLALTEPLKGNTVYEWRVRAENSVGGSGWSPYSTFATGLRTSNEVIPGPEIPDQVSLEQNYPNPFNPTTTIRFGLPAISNVKLEIYNVLGQRVSTLANGSMNAGWHQITFDGSHLSSGVYLYRLVTGEGEMRVKMFTLIK